MATLAGAAVALVILVDLATGQGPPVYTNYLRAREEMRPLPGPMINTGGYLPPPSMGAVYGADPMEPEKDYAKSDKLDKKEELKEKFGEKEYEKEYGHGEVKFGDKATTTAPGIYDRIMKSFGR